MLQYKQWLISKDANTIWLSWIKMDKVRCIEKLRNNFMEIVFKTTGESRGKKSTQMWGTCGIALTSKSAWCCWKHRWEIRIWNKGGGLEESQNIMISVLNNLDIILNDLLMGEPWRTVNPRMIRSVCLFRKIILALIQKMNWKRTVVKPRKSLIKYRVAQSRDDKGCEVTER